MDRGSLNCLQDSKLCESEITITSGREVRLFTLVNVAGRGATAVTWKARDSSQNFVAIKFTLKSEFSNHSVYSEKVRVNELKGAPIAPILGYGTPVFSSKLTVDSNEILAIIVQWEDGKTLREYLDCNPALTPESYLRLAHSLCLIVASLGAKSLVHNDLHDRNLLIRHRKDPLTGESNETLVAIDTGQLKTEDTRTKLLEKWQTDFTVLELQNRVDLSAEIKSIKARIAYFRRTDLDWAVKHLTELFNVLRRSPASRSLTSRRFLSSIPEILSKAVHPDAAHRYTDAATLYSKLDESLARAQSRNATELLSPFDLVSAEMIRNDGDLMELFADDYPKLKEVRGAGSIYLYGPRGCGKSTILRSLSLNAILTTKDVGAELEKVAYLGVYVSCSQELRTRFWLADADVLSQMTSQLVRFFSLLLLYELSETLARVYLSDLQGKAQVKFGMTSAIANRSVAAVLKRASLQCDRVLPEFSNPFEQLKLRISIEQDKLWEEIVQRRITTALPDAQMVFDITKRLAEEWPFLQSKRLAFLLDDYSNQRIPAALQRQLNQVITFSRQKNPVFKVASEFQGLELDGIDASREVQEINVGLLQTSRRGKTRCKLLSQLLEKRFARLDVKFSSENILGYSSLEPSIALARAIRKASRDNQDFQYHGIDTIFDVCGGNLALGIEIVRTAFSIAAVPWEKPVPIHPKSQHEAIHSVSDRQFDYIKHRTLDGGRKWLIADKLCWLAGRLVTEANRSKSGKSEPRVQTHIDIAETALFDLGRLSEESRLLFDELVRKGILVSLKNSRERKGHSGTARYFISPILLAKYHAPFGRDVALKISDSSELLTMLTEPETFVQSQLIRAGVVTDQRKLFD